MWPFNCKKKENPIIEITIKEKDLLERFNKTCFHKIECSPYIPYSYERKTYIKYEELKYSGLTVEIENRKILYECLKNNDVLWIQKEDLKFPKMKV